MKSKNGIFRQVITRAHVYAGLFVSPFVVLYSVTAIGFNHAVAPAEGQKSERRGVSVQIDSTLDNLPLAESIRSQLGITGEIIFVGRNRGSLYIPIGSPGEKITVNVDLAAGAADVQTEKTGLYDALLYLHKMPGPHVAAIRGNWWVTRVWGYLADTTVYCLLFLTASGVYIWLVLGLPRRTGYLVAAGGGLLFTVLIALLV